MAKEIVYGEDFRRRIQSGVDMIADAVKITLGPRARNAVIHHPSVSPLIANEGAIITKEIELEGSVENMGAGLMRDLASKTQDIAGDGVTTAAVLARSIIREGFKNAAAGANLIELKKGIQGATQVAVAAIRKLARRVEARDSIARVAASAADDPEIGALVALALDSVGKDGVITVEESGSRDTTMDVKEGMHLERGYLSPEMTTDKEKMAAELRNPYILLTDRKITDPRELVPLLERVAKTGRPLLIVAESVEGGALGMLVMNKRNGVLDAVAVHPPAYGDGRRSRMEDLALLTGGTYITGEMGHELRETKIDMLGSAASVRVDRRSTVIIGGAGDREAVAARSAFLRRMIEKAEYDFDRKQLEERLARIAGGIASIKAGGVTETEMKGKKLRIEGALIAARAAVSEGIVPGGGITYLRAIPAVKAYMKTLSGDMRTGAAIISRALEEPARQIGENAGTTGGAVVAEVLRSPAGIGFNAVTHGYTNMLEAGIVDSAKVTRLALQNAASVSTILLTTEACIIGVKG